MRGLTANIWGEATTNRAPWCSLYCDLSILVPSQPYSPVSKQVKERSDDFLHLTSLRTALGPDPKSDEYTIICILQHIRTQLIWSTNTALFGCCKLIGLLYQLVLDTLCGTEDIGVQAVTERIRKHGVMALGNWVLSLYMTLRTFWQQSHTMMSLALWAPAGTRSGF